MSGICLSTTRECTWGHAGGLGISTSQCLLVYMLDCLIRLAWKSVRLIRCLMLIKEKKRITVAVGRKFIYLFFQLVNEVACALGVSVGDCLFIDMVQEGERFVFLCTFKFVLYCSICDVGYCTFTSGRTSLCFDPNHVSYLLFV